MYMQKSFQSAQRLLLLCVLLQHELIDQEQETDVVEEQEYYAEVYCVLCCTPSITIFRSRNIEDRARTNFQQLCDLRILEIYRT